MGELRRGQMSYNALDGLMIAENVTFANFGVHCEEDGTRDFIIASNPAQSDGQHPVIFRNIHLVNVSNSSLVWIHRPDQALINPADCVDMDCDGMKKTLLTDEDGSFLGSPGTVIAQSEFGWGDQSRGLGDYRIPQVALADANGHLRPIDQVYKYRGIIRNESSCVLRTDWQAWECHGIDHRMLIIESMDNDTEHRRISPVAIISDTNQYVDLINGPQDHGWCFGYTCQTRVSTFMSIVAHQHNFDVFLSSTAPQQLRFRILNANSSFAIRLAMYYSTSMRVDLYKNGVLVPPTNAYYVNGNMMLRDFTSNLAAYMPTYANASGSNLFVKSDSKIYFTARGGDYYDLNIASVLFIQFGVPAITDEAFFDSNTLVANFAALLGCKQSQIRYVNVVRATHSRRKREIGTNSSVNYISFQIFDNPVEFLANVTEMNATHDSLLALTASITNQIMTGQLQNETIALFNVTIVSSVMQRPLSTTPPQQIKRLQTIEVVTEASGCRAQSPCDVQPVLKVLDEDVHLLCSTICICLISEI